MVEADLVIEAASGLFFMVLGVWVLRIRPRRLANGVFSLFLLAWGANRVIANVALLATLFNEPLFILGTVLNLVVVAALVWLALVFPRPLVAADRAALVAAALVGGAVSVALAGGIVVGQAGVVDATGGPLAPGFLTFITTFGLVIGAHFYAMFLWTFRYFNCDDGVTRRQYALVTAALLAFIGFMAGTGPEKDASIIAGIRTGNSFLVAFNGVILGLVVAVALVWLYAQHRRPDGRIGRNMAWFALGTALLGVLYSFMEPWGAYALSRLVAVALLTVGILRFQLLAVDIRLRWGISKSTIAAVFITVFFIASEAAQVFFGSTLGSQYAGILAAGALVFAIAPLSRVADRLAEKAVPLVSVSSEGGTLQGRGLGSPDAVYRAALRAAMRDGILTRREEIHLAEVAEGLEIGPRRALEIRAEVEEEAE